MAYLAVRGSSGGPLFLFQDGRPLSRAILTTRIREILASAGVSGNFSNHSFRIGAATVAARSGIPDHLTQALGHWSSNAYRSYIRTPSETLASLSSHLISSSHDSWYWCFEARRHSCGAERHVLLDRASLCEGLFADFADHAAYVLLDVADQAAWSKDCFGLMWIWFSRIVYGLLQAWLRQGPGEGSYGQPGNPTQIPDSVHAANRCLLSSCGLAYSCGTWRVSFILCVSPWARGGCLDNLLGCGAGPTSPLFAGPFALPSTLGTKALGGCRSQSCHGYLCALLEARFLPWNHHPLS